MLAQRVWTMDGPPTTGAGVMIGDAAFMGDSFLEWPFWIAVGLGMIAWLILARSSLVNGGDMERSDRVPQLYGYTVCLIAIVVMLVNVSSIVNRSFTLANPLVSNGPFGWSGATFSSFDAYKATVMFSSGPPTAGASTAPKPTDAELRTQFEALRADQIARNRLDARRELTERILMLLLSAALFAWHWRWVRRERVA